MRNYFINILFCNGFLICSRDDFLSSISNHVNHFFTLQLFVVSLIQAVVVFLHNKVINFEFLCRSFYYFFFDWIFSDQSVDYNLFFLSNSMCSVNSLQVNLWVPIWIKDDNDISTMKVNTESSCSCWQNEQLFIWALSLKIIDALLTVRARCLSINSAILIPSEAKEIIQNVKQASHLTED